MRHRPRSTTVTLTAVALLAACDSDPGRRLAAPVGADHTELAGRASFEWSEPEWLGPVVNSDTRELNPELAPDGRALYFTAERDGGVHIYVSRRTSKACPWGAPVKLGAPINSSGADFSPALSPDGRLLFFASTGHGGFGGQDIFVSRRIGAMTEDVWGQPENLGPQINTADDEHSPAFLQSGSHGGELYFNRGLPPTTLIYVAPMNRDGGNAGTATYVTELNDPSPTFNNGAVTVRRDGRELIFWSGGAAGERPGTIGLADLFVSTRASVNEPWSTPVDLGRPVNSEVAELEATLSSDGQTLIFSSARPGGLGRQDLWMSQRGPASRATPEPPAHCTNG